MSYNRLPSGRPVMDVAMLLLGLGVLVAGLGFSSVLILTVGSSDQISGELVSGLGALVVGVCSLPLLWAFSFRHNSKAQHLVDRLMGGFVPKQAFGVFLRPFDSEGGTHMGSWGGLRADKEGKSLEKVLVQAASEIGIPTVGLGEGSGSASRAKTDDADWQQAIQQMCGNAKLLVLVVSGHAGTQYEINMIFVEKYLGKTLFVVPPQDDRPDDRYDPRSDYEAARPSFKLHGIDLPEWSPGGGLFYVRAGELEVCSLGWPDQVVQDRIIKFCQELAGRSG